MGCSAGRRTPAQSTVPLAFAAQTHDKNSKWHKHEENIPELCLFSSCSCYRGAFDFEQQ